MIAQEMCSPQSSPERTFLSTFESLLHADNMPSYRWGNRCARKQDRCCFSHGCKFAHFLKPALHRVMDARSRDPGFRPSSPPWAPSVSPTALRDPAGGGRGGCPSPGPGARPSVLFHKPASPGQGQRACLSSGEQSVPLPWECLSCSKGGILAFG